MSVLPLFPGLPGGPESILLPIIMLLVFFYVLYRILKWLKAVVESAAGMDEK